MKPAFNRPPGSEYKTASASALPGRNPLLVALLSAGIILIGGLAQAQNRDSTAVQPVLTEEQIEQRYEAAKERCEQLDGDQKDVCEQEAKTEREKAEADAEFRKEASEAHEDAVKRKNEAEWNLAKERCDAMSGDAKDACMADARAKHNR